MKRAEQALIEAHDGAGAPCLLSKVLVIIWQGLSHGSVDLGLICRLLVHVDLHLGRGQGNLLHKVQVGVPAAKSIDVLIGMSLAPSQQGIRAGGQDNSAVMPRPV